MAHLPDQPIAEIDNFTYEALRRYWAAHDMDLGKGYPYVWDLRMGAVNRWPDKIVTLIDPPDRRIHYTLYLRRGDEVDESEFAMEYGEWPPAPDSWLLVWSEGLFEGPLNPATDEWDKEARSRLHISEAEFNKWIEENPEPPQFLPTDKNWSPDRAREEIEKIIPEAQRELVEKDPGKLKWAPNRFIIEPPE